MVMSPHIKEKLKINRKAFKAIRKSIAGLHRAHYGARVVSHTKVRENMRGLREMVDIVERVVEDIIQGREGIGDESRKA